MKSEFLIARGKTLETSEIQHQSGAKSPVSAGKIRDQDLRVFDVYLEAIEEEKRGPILNVAALHQFP